MKVHILVENTSCGECAGEHGLSLYIEHEGKNYLIDTGATGLFSENAEKMGVDLAEIDEAFLSHAHYDHSGGFREFFAQNQKAKVYLQEACKKKYYYKITESAKKYIGIPADILDIYEDRFVYVDGYRKLGDGVFICPHTTPQLWERGRRAHMFGILDATITADDFAHEQTIVFEEKGGLYLFNSCSHGGVENVIEEIKAQFPGKVIKAFFGGFHMMGAKGVDSCNFTEEEVKQVGSTLLRTSGAVFYTGHCTGNVAGVWLKEVMGDRFKPFHSGMEVEV
ncbi:MAG: MBL fold metallo-hydrolase [Eubacteriales bacterium]|nr:MBL fold metallo-hydrolase [Eubacteriales bacterium]